MLNSVAGKESTLCSVAEKGEQVRMAVSLLLTTLLVSLAIATPAVTKNKPHIVMMLVDDWGWANVGYHRDPPTKEVVTPNMDSLVTEGLELDQHYAFKVCSPSRSSLISGRLPIHVCDENVPPNHYNPSDPVSGFEGIPRNMTGIGTKMADGGYITHQVGKWHAGMATPDHTPVGRGFKTSFGYFSAANDYYNETAGGSCDGTPIVDLWDTNAPAKGKNGTGYEDSLFKEQVLEIIKSHDPAVPLFLYYAPHIVHKPYQVPKKYLDKFDFIDDENRRFYHAMVNFLDDAVGEIVQELKQKQMWNNLLFVVSSDNGGPESSGAGANNFPLKGGKHSDWQGGVRVNAFVSGGFLPEKMRGQKTKGYIHLADWYATFCALAGVDPTDERAAKAKLPPIDSLNMWPLISGQNSTSPRTDIPISNVTLISGDYKILQGTVSEAGWTGPHYPNVSTPAGIDATEKCGDGGCLYNIKDDPEEHVNLADSMENVLKEMRDKLAMYQATYFNPNRGGKWNEACEVALDKYGGFWGPFLP